MQKIIILFFIGILISCKTDNKKELKEGNILWQHNDLGENLESTPAIDNACNVYTICSRTLYSFSLDGIFQWLTKTTAGDANSVSITSDNKAVYMSGIKGLFALNTEDENI